MEKCFKNRWIVITRPVHQAGNLSNILCNKGANIIPFPLIEIVPPSFPALVQQQVENLSAYNMAIFISPNAVERTLHFADKNKLMKLEIAAVGKKTALSLANHNIPVTCFPEKKFNSEAVLALETMQQVQGMRIAIFRGEGGRNLLRDTLRARGATVDYINVYARGCPVDNISLLKQHYLQNKLDIIILTSGESFSHLLRLSKGEDWFNNIPLLVGSERIKQKFKKLYTGKLWVAPDPSDETIYKSLCKFLC